MAPLIEDIENLDKSTGKEISRIYEEALNNHFEINPFPVECSVSFVFRVNNGKLQTLVSNRKYKIEPKATDGYQIQVSGGKHDLDEDPLISSLRELNEEVGISVDELVKTAFAATTPFPAGENQIFFCWPFFYFIKDATKEIYSAQEKDKTGDWYWIDFEELYKKAIEDHPSIFAMYEGFTHFSTKPIEDLIEYLEKLSSMEIIEESIISKVRELTKLLENSNKISES